MCECLYKTVPLGLFMAFFYDCVIIADKVKGEGRQTPFKFYVILSTYSYNTNQQNAPLLNYYFNNLMFLGPVHHDISFEAITNLTLNLPTTTIVAQPFNVIKWQVKFNPVA